ncbi:MAG: outer membrane lipoprotein LolB [Sulfuritalea sp.]|nr:outer membrane lipoprotein LolB [Sulfuritalea sp.]
MSCQIPIRLWLAYLGALLLAGCAELKTSPDTAPELGPPLQVYSAEGRISLRQGGRSDHLKFRWERTRERDSVLFMSPLGQGLAELTRDATGARLHQPNQALIEADNLPQLAQRVFGAPLPLEAMAEWMRGAKPSLSGKVDGWQVLISDTLPYRQRRLLRVMEASRGDVELKLVVDDWDAPE